MFGANRNMETDHQNRHRFRLQDQRETAALSWPSDSILYDALQMHFDSPERGDINSLMVCECRTDKDRQWHGVDLEYI